MNKETTIYKTTGKLSTHPHILCSKCQGKTTMFGSNLEGRIKKFGTLENLLESFQCKQCRGADKPSKPIKVKKERKKKLATKLENDQVVYDIPKYSNEPPTVINLLEDKEMCGKLTENECWRPDIYLNNSKTCDNCKLYNNCKSPVRRLARSLVRK